jgi:hypothetical protein
MDKGMISAHCHKHPSVTLLPSCWETRGYSYQMNLGHPVGLPIPAERKPIAGELPGQNEGWVPEPSKFILFYEPPAALQVCHDRFRLFDPRWYQWHRNRGKTDFLDPRLAPALFCSPTLFVDGHAKFINFSRSLCSNVYYPFEETRDWAWYKPSEQLSP